MATSSLHINNLDLLVHLGFTDKEREEKQMVRVAIDLHFLTPPKACQNDQLADTICYDALITAIFEKITNKPFHLVEHLSENIYTLLKSMIGNETKIIIHITKHPAIKHFTGDVCFSFGD